MEKSHAEDDGEVAVISHSMVCLDTVSKREEDKGGGEVVQIGLYNEPTDDIVASLEGVGVWIGG